MHTLQFQWKDGKYTTCKGGNKKDLEKFAKRMINQDKDYMGYRITEDKKC